MSFLEIVALLGDILIILGAIIFGICAVGVLKFRDVYTRLSVIGTAGGSGIILVIIGVWMQDPQWLDGLKAVGAIILLLGTSALGSILIARAALLRRTPMIEPIFDDTKLLSEECVD
ncbi:cation:proton antiporter [Corynebacterium yudongzhengii]|uniref:Cation:proton antiporter n=1 Tax=Corynebacterium yudongzhengii TaxID=2080740 RepID=A0A2U1T6B3_9CORY|nr:monovalent cation/H(+) antiporter subunit G [Corynebacterium yudongzhengii]AWB81653.1 cation:proton antiporter [Corynebacterium yudongzhengii]PWC01544.1 cation:proton antiporter [Corynebacterium yudongzhengii]